jgi:DNA mismatch repair protein MutL
VSLTRNNRPWIRPLPERLINKIAAGEVVERPASVVKELVENALDAGSNRIDIFIEKSGTRLIKIVDNGCGIDEEQIEIAFSRHATSKISEFNDLDRIESYGFRGEALPSIASVSRMRMVSRPTGADSGTEIIFEGGVLQSKKPAAAPVGTVVEVENLFFNTPARRKFLKAETTEARHVTRVAMALAMGRYQVGFSYHLNGRQIFALPSGLGLKERVPALLAPGKEFVEVSGEVGPVRILGYVGAPGLAQSNRNSQFLFINGRYIHSPSLSHALAAGFGELLPKGNFPVGALLLQVDPTEVDVNVHPAKTEVRLSREREIYDAVYRLVKAALRHESVIPQLQVPGEPAHRPSPTGWTPPVVERNSNVIPGITSRDGGGAHFLGELYRNTPPVAPLSTPSVVRVDVSTGEIISDDAPVASQEPKGPEDIRLIGRFDDLYQLFQVGHELYILDQHTAHERVLFEETMRQMDAHGSVGQQLLLTVQLELGAEQMGLFDEAYDVLTQAGFAVELFGGNTVRIEAVPAILARRSPEKAFRSILDDVASLKKSGYDLKKAVAQSVACRSAVMSGDRLSDREAVGLVERLLKCENRYSCPHGRPTFIRLSREYLDKQFGRA